jgi:hypothetical protein
MEDFTHGRLQKEDGLEDSLLDADMMKLFTPPSLE